MKRESRAPLIVAIVLLLLPVLYVGSYLALVVPGGVKRPIPTGVTARLSWDRYRIGGNWSVIIFWPLEQIDRKLRPGAWESFEDRLKSRRLSP